MCLIGEVCHPVVDREPRQEAPDVPYTAADGPCASTCTQNSDVSLPLLE